MAEIQSHRCRPLIRANRWLGHLGVMMLILLGVEGVLMVMAPVWLLLPIKSVAVRKIYRQLMTTMQLIYLGLLGFVIEIVCGMRLHISGSEELLERRLEKPVIISNHRTRVDWLFLICLSLRLRRLGTIKIALKEDMKYIPFIGWAMQCFLFPFISRKDKMKDLSTIRNNLEYLTAIQHPHGCSLVIFPEGTDLSKSNLEKSNSVQSEKNMPVWKQVLLPRAGGLSEGLDTLRSLNAIDGVIDVTIGYIDFLPFERASEKSLWMGRFPREVHMHLDLINWPDIPQSNEETQTWLQERFSIKEGLLKKFYSPLGLYGSNNEGVSEPCSDMDDKMSDTSTIISNLEPVLGFQVDEEPCEETMSKDMRFVQYTMNSYVICCLLAVIVHLMFWSGIWFFPLYSFFYGLLVITIGAGVTHFIGGFHVLELEVFPVNVEVPDVDAELRERAMSDRSQKALRLNTDFTWSKLVNYLGSRNSARRTAYLESLRRRTATLFRSNE